MKTVKMNRKKPIYLLVLFFMLIFSAIFLNSFYWPYEEISKRKVVVGCISLGLVVVVPILCVKIQYFYENITGFLRHLENIFVQAKNNRKKIFLFFVISIVGVALSYISAQVLSIFLFKTAYNPKLFEAFVALSAIIIVMIFLWKIASRYQECIFVLIALIMGVFSIAITPNRVGISWDDEVHYRKTLEISNVLNGIMYIADERNVDEYANNIYGQTGFDRETALQYEEELENSYELKQWNVHDFSEYGMESISYVPAAIGIMLGRGLELSYLNIFNMGRMVNLLSYTLLIYLAMKRLKHGKMIIATIGLIPTSVFMASSYSYDWWVTGFTILGFSYFFAELQEDSLLSNKSIVIMVGSLMLGCMPKAIYFPILFPLLFMPKNKFKNSKQRMWYYLVIVGVGLCLVASFMLPRFVHGIGTGDSRGGTEVNSTEQVLYILQNPFTFAKTLFEFLKYYISPQSTGPMLQRLAYVGEGEFYGIVSLILIVVAFLDRGDSYKRNILVRSTGVVGCIVALILATTALYVSFTAVGLDTVLGMQGRYMIPFIFPTLYCLGTGGTQHKINKNLFVFAPMVIIALTFIYNMVRLCVIRY